MSPAKKVPILIQIINDYYATDVKKKIGQNDPLNEARFVAMMLIRRHTTYTYKRISEFINHKGDSYAVITNLEKRILEQPSLLIRVSRIEKLFFQKIK